MTLKSPWLALALVAAHSLAYAGDRLAVGCQTVALVLDDGLTPHALDRLWASGDPAPGAPAVLQLRGCDGALLDSITLEAPLARLDHALLRGTHAPTVLVTVDLTAPAGSYSGLLTRPIQVMGNRLAPAQARAAGGQWQPIVLAHTGKAAWKRVRVGAAEQLLSVRSEPQEGHFTTRYRRYMQTKQGWAVHARTQPGLWESDGDFPSRQSFP